MEPTYYNRLTQWFFDKVGKIACKLGDHSFTWKLKSGETIKLIGPIPDRATCRYCGITHLKASK